MGEALPDLADAPASSNEPELPCEGVFHSTGLDGHSGPAAFVVTATCPHCGGFDVVLMCAGRVEFIMKRDGDFRCGACASTFHWRDGWALAPLHGGSAR